MSATFLVAPVGGRGIADIWWEETRGLLNILQRTGQPCSVKNYLFPNRAGLISLVLNLGSFQKTGEIAVCASWTVGKDSLALIGFPGFNAKVSACNAGTWVRTLGWEDPLEKEMETHSSILAWKIPRMEEPSRLQTMGLQRIGHDWATSLSLYKGFTECLALGGVFLCAQGFLIFSSLPGFSRLTFSPSLTHSMCVSWEGKWETLNVIKELLDAKIFLTQITSWKTLQNYVGFICLSLICKWANVFKVTPPTPSGKWSWWAGGWRLCLCFRFGASQPCAMESLGG